MAWWEQRRKGRKEGSIERRKGRKEGGVERRKGRKSGGVGRRDERKGGRVEIGGEGTVESGEGGTVERHTEKNWKIRKIHIPAGFQQSLTQFFFRLIYDMIFFSVRICARIYLPLKDFYAL